MKKNKEATFGMIKPEALEKGIAEEIIKRINKSGLCIIKQEERKITDREFLELYGHAENNIPKIFPKLKFHLTQKNTILLKIVGDNAVMNLLRLRGASNPKDAEPGTIRGDFAGSQDYKELYEKGEISLNFFHAADSKEEAEKMIYLFFPENGI